jgi:Flp pilus assembly protein CpaB
MPRLRRPRSLVHTARRAAAALLAVTALVLALRPRPVPATAGEPAAVPVVVAGADLPAGTVLTEGHLGPARLPPDLVPAGVQPDVDVLVGRVLAGAVRAGEVLTDVRLVGTGVTASLLDGQVAAPVRLADLAVAALVRTGDRVDVLATAPDAERAELVAPAALVLAAPLPVSDGTDPAAGLLLLAVDAPTAERLAAAATTATLTVSLPPPHGAAGT